ncbi:VOC family protein [Rhizobium calliandrae]|uniref:VOC family protein n=2 Tax=Rhizobium calliandrae TaxID=1312182 RepID=A0ABT7KQ32_9HYPH|nr:VOC family protein [Rhizobium calliandrae]MDL2410746.1 VOC family protein [Rhizobium calliandrae]
MSVSKRRIDHIVLAVQDLEAAARFYERLGLRLRRAIRHPWGKENRLVQFGSSFVGARGHHHAMPHGRKDARHGRPHAQVRIAASKYRGLNISDRH